MKNHTLFLMGAAVGVLLFAASAKAQMANEPWSFAPQNRASIAALIRQVESQEAMRVAAAGASNGTTLVCGSDGASAATGNSTCVILNNAMGEVDVGQDSNGDQGASSNTSQTTSTPADDILATLQGN